MAAITRQFAGAQRPDWPYTEDADSEDIEDDLSDGQITLVQLGLITLEADGLLLHRFIRDFIHLQTNFSEQSEIVQLAVEQGILDAANRANNASNWLELRQWQTHLLHITAHAQTRTDEIAAGLCNTTAYFLKNSNADYAAARPYYARAVDIYRHVLGDTHPDTVIIVTNYLTNLLSTGEQELVVTFLLEELGPTHPLTQQLLGESE